MFEVPRCGAPGMIQYLNEKSACPHVFIDSRLKNDHIRQVRQHGDGNEERRERCIRGRNERQDGDDEHVGRSYATVYTANATARGPYSISAAAGTITNNFSETNLPGPATQMAANAGTTPQTATINTAFANPPAVTMKDASNNPVAGVSVQFSAPSTGPSGLFSNSSTSITIVTNASGVASAPFTANGNAGGPYTVQASASGLTSVTFSLTNTAGSAASMTANAGTTPQFASTERPSRRWP